MLSHLLQRAAVLVDTHSEGEFFAVLDRLSEKRWEQFEDDSWVEQRDKLTRYQTVFMTTLVTSAFSLITLGDRKSVV